MKIVPRPKHHKNKHNAEREREALIARFQFLQRRKYAKYSKEDLVEMVINREDYFEEQDMFNYDIRSDIEDGLY